VSSSYPWFTRGGYSNNDSNAGLWYSYYYRGVEYSDTGFRVVAQNIAKTISITAQENIQVACVSGTQFKGNVGNMQNINTSSWNVGDTGIATDIRNNQEYCIGKLRDDKVWMLDNLKLELGKTDSDPIKDTRILEPTNTNVEGNTYVYFTQDGTATGQAMTGMSDNFTISGYNTRSGASSNTPPNYDAWRQNNPSNVAACIDNYYSDNGNGDITYNTNSKTGCGYLYNYYTATAGSAAQADYNNGKGAGYIAQQSICPAGWKLPSGQNASGDFGTLDQAYKPGGTGSDHSLAKPDTQGLWLSAGAWQGALSGYYESGFGNQGSVSWYWSSSVMLLNLAYTTYFHGSDVYPGTYNGSGRSVGFAVRCLLAPPAPTNETLISGLPSSTVAGGESYGTVQGTGYEIQNLTISANYSNIDIFTGTLVIESDCNCSNIELAFSSGGVFWSSGSGTPGSYSITTDLTSQGIGMGGSDLVGIITH
jgi:uncharacterized protein (TIGR02145 family)